jgi:hypothetical protein
MVVVAVNILVFVPTKVVPKLSQIALVEPTSVFVVIATLVIEVVLTIGLRLKFIDFGNRIWRKR